MPRLKFYLLLPPPRGPRPHARLEDNLHLTVFALGGGLLGGRFLRGILLPGEIGQVRIVLVLIKILTLSIIPLIPDAFFQRARLDLSPQRC